MVSKFQKVINFLYKRFVQEMGREPATPKEIMDIQNEAVQYFNKTKGVPLRDLRNHLFKVLLLKLLKGVNQKKELELYLKIHQKPLQK